MPLMRNGSAWRATPTEQRSGCKWVAARPSAYTSIRADSPLLHEVGSPFSGPSCPLGFISNRLYLLTFFSGLERVLASHFLRHYVSNVGVRPTHVRAFVHEVPGHREAEAAAHLTVQSFVEMGVPRRLVRIVGGAYTDPRRLELINAEIRALPNGSWVIHADGECPSRRTIRQASRLTSLTVCRVSLCSRRVLHLPVCAAAAAWPRGEAARDVLCGDARRACPGRQDWRAACRE